MSSEPEPLEPADVSPGPEVVQDPRGKRALLWSFFVPPMGAVVGGLLLWRVRREPGATSVRAEARLAVLNGVVSTIVVWKMIVFARWALDALPAYIERTLYGY
jgi:hypothetical protein